MSIGTVLVTGGASGLGAAVVDAVCEAGGRPVVLDRMASDGSDVEHQVVDLADRPAAEAAVGRVAQRHGGINGVVTCAGIDSCGRLEDVPADDWERVVTVNLLGSVRVIRAALPHLHA